MGIQNIDVLKKKKVGIVLGSGGARGFAHVGVLKVFEQKKIPIDFISGSSMGALIAGLYSAEPNAKKIEKEIKNSNPRKLLSYTISKTGIVSTKKLEKFLEEKLEKINFKEVKIPLFITSYDMEERREIIFNRGDVAKAIRASISIPGIFCPVENKGRILFDGGLIDPFPTEVLREAGADIIVAVNVNYMKLKNKARKEEATRKTISKKIPNLLSSSARALHIMSAESSEYDLKENKADVVINIDLSDIDTFDFSKSEKAIKAGERAARKAVSEIIHLTENPIKSFVQNLDREIKEKIIKKR